MTDQLPTDGVTPGAFFETTSKIFASGVIVIYACGFLITSIHDFQYGFSAMNPFRPRILTAGAWFFIFLAVPFALVRQIIRTEAYKQSHGTGVTRLVNLSWAYLISCALIIFTSKPIFSFDSAPVAQIPHFRPWEITLCGVGIVALIVALVKYAKRLPRWVKTVLTAGSLIFMVWTPYDDVFNLGRFQSGAITLWLLAAGAVFAFELTMRDWKLTLGNWPQTLIALLASILIFATRYYPHILSSWGGGIPVPITVTYTKDAVKTPSQDVGYLLIEETDAGFYAVAGNDKTATFIPRANVGMVRFSRLLPVSGTAETGTTAAPRP